MDRIRVMLADDNLNILKVLSDYLGRKPDVEVVAAVSDGVETRTPCASTRRRSW